MQLLQPKQINVAAKENLADDEVPTAEIIDNGELTNCWVSGAILEAAVKTDDNNIILFLTDDIPQEDTLSIHLLDSHFSLLDSVTIGSIYSTGSFSNLQLDEPNQLQFKFIGEKDWKLQLLKNSEFALPFISEPKGVHRKFGFSRHFKIANLPVMIATSPA